MKRILFKIPLVLVALVGGYFLLNGFQGFRGLKGSEFTPGFLQSNSFRLYNHDSDFPQFNQMFKQLERLLLREGLIGGGVVVVSRNEKVIYAHGFGYSDREAGIPAEPYHLFRVASVSKLITAVGIMKLVELGKIGLHQKVLGSEGILRGGVYDNYLDKRVENITVFQLLNHSAGWSNRWGDPMFMASVIAEKIKQPLPIQFDDITSFVLSKRLHFQPGSTSAYSNFGYALLGEVIEKASGMSYERYIQSQILYPLGIFDMQLGGSYVEERVESEVKYYESDSLYLVDDYTGRQEKVRRAYGGTDINTLGPAGGWIASATDLMKLLLALDGFESIPDVLSSETLEIMADNQQNKMSPLGWRKTDPRGWFRTGTLAGTSALMVRKPNGINYVVLLNCANHKGPGLTNDLFRVMETALKNIGEWPDMDLFQHDRSWSHYKKGEGATVHK